MPRADQFSYQDTDDEEWLYLAEKDHDRWLKKSSFKEPYTSDRRREQKRRKSHAHRERDQ